MSEIDLRLTGIGLLELVRFLYKLEAADGIFIVETLNIKPRYLKPQILDVTMRLALPNAT